MKCHIFLTGYLKSTINFNSLHNNISYFVFIFYRNKTIQFITITICMAVAVSLIMCYISYKYDSFVRIGKFEDKLFNIKLNCMKEKYCLEEVIYQIKPLKKDMNKNVQQSYIVAFSEFTEDCKSCKMRFIKPKNGESFILNCKSFEIYDDFTMIGSGELS